MGIASPWQKYRWAERHLQELEREVRAFEKGHAYRFTCDPDTDGTKYVFKIHDLQPAKLEWGLILGDCFHNLRSSLDHLAYELAVSATNGALTPAQERQVMFPIFDSPDNYKRHGAWRIKMLRPEDRTLIEELQPYNSGSDGSDWEHFYGQLNQALGVLDRLDVIDKHRSVHVTRSAVEWMAVLNPPGVVSTSIHMEALEDGAVVASWSFDGQPPPPIPTQVEMHGYFPIEVAIHDTPWAIRVGEAIRQTTNATRIVLDMFDPSVVHADPPKPVPTRQPSARAEMEGPDGSLIQVPTAPAAPLWDDRRHHWPPSTEKG